jgi:ubiquinone/menaquinone biosynthesis C-methylase UbiE
MGADLAGYREQSRKTWDEMAKGWEARREWLMATLSPVSEWLIDKLDPQRGQTVLELASGTGDLGFGVAERLGDGGRLISSDFSAQMVEVARRNGASRGLPNVEHRVLDAERMDLEEDSVDGVVCRFGYMLMADPAAALTQTRRVLRTGGRLSFAVWRTPDVNPWAATPAITLVQRGHVPAPEPGAPGMFAMGDPERTRELLRGAGFAEPELEQIDFEFSYADFDDFWDSIMSLAGPLARAIGELPEQERQSTREAIAQAMERFRDEQGSYTCPASVWGALTR